MHRLFATCICGLLCVAVPAWSATTGPLLDLDAAVAYALENNRALRLADEQAETERLGIDAARQDFMLRVRPTVEYSARSGETFASYGIAADRRLTTGTELSTAVTRSEGRLATGTPFSVNRFSVELRQPLFRRWGVAAATEPVRAATAEWRRAAREVELLRAATAMAVVRSYESVRRLRGQVSLTREAVQRISAHYRVTRSREASGRQRRLDTLRAELQLGQARARLEREQEQLAAVEREFAELIGAPEAFAAPLAPVTASYLAVDPDDAVTVALENRVDHAQAQHFHAEARHAALLAERERRPDLSMYVRFQRFEQTLSPAELAWFGAGGVSVGLVGGFSADAGRARVAAARAARVAVSAFDAIEVSEHRIRREVLDAVAAYSRAHADANLAALNHRLAQRQLELARRLFAIRRSDAPAVADAEDALARAESDALHADGEVNIQTYALAYAMGTLVDAPDELKPQAPRR